NVVKMIKDPAKRAALRAKKSADAKLAAKAKQWDPMAKYLVTNVWDSPVAVSFRHEVETNGYLTTMLEVGGKLELLGVQLSEQLKGLALPRSSRKSKPVVTIELLSSSSSSKEDEEEED